MTKLMVYAAVLIGLSATATLALNQRNAISNAKAEAVLAVDGAFRDGLYLGRLSAENGQRPRPAIGRWSSEQDRLMFAAGFRRGYEQSHAQNRSHVEPAQ